MAEGVILFGHGSRDAAWHAPMDAVAARVAQRAPAMRVACAYLELTAPDLPQAVQAMAEAGVQRIRVLPIFLGMGRHAREDLPRLIAELRQQHPRLALELLPPVGTDDRVIDLLARLAVPEA